MAAAHVTTRSILSSFFPRLSSVTASSSTKFTTVYSRQLSLPVLPAFGFAIPSAISLNVPGLLEGLWESVLRAVPKKKTSHMKGRSRRMAGKGMKDVTALNMCSACGHVKRAHLLCPYCVKELQNMFKAANPNKAVHLPGEKLKVEGAFLVPAVPRAKYSAAKTKSTAAETTQANKPVDK